MWLVQHKALAVIVVFIAALAIVLTVVVVNLLQPAAEPTIAWEPTATATPTPTAKTEQQILDESVKTYVSLYSQLVCTNLAEHPTADLNDAVDKVLAQYATVGLSDESRVELAHRVLTESAAKSCPEQSERVSQLAVG